MRTLPVELDDDTVDALEMERRLIGFDSREAYVRWIVANRASIAEEAGESRDLLESYRERLATVEQRLAERADDETADSVRSNGRTPSPDRDEVPNAVSSDARADGRGADAGVGADGGPGDSGPAASESQVDGDGWAPSRSDPSIQVRGSPRTTVSRDGPIVTGDGSTADERLDDPGSGKSGDAADDDTERDASTATDATPSGDPGGNPESGSRSASGSGAGAEPDSAYLSPERVVRISGDPVAEDANVLETVEFDRLDELSRRAVAKTRSRLNRQVETGLEYRSSTELTDRTIRPGEDVVDLDTLSVPGHDEDVIEARREVAGRAIAFLRDDGRARKSDLVEALYASHPAGYETADSWWECLKCALKQVDAIEGGEGSRLWRYRD